MIVFVPIFFSINLKTIDCLKGEKVKSFNATFANRKNQPFDEVIKFINMPV